MNTLILSILAFVLSSFWLGFWMVIRLLRPPKIDLLSLLLCAVVGFGFGLGINSLFVFLLLVLHLPIQPLFFTMLDLAIGTLFWFLSRKDLHFQFPRLDQRLDFIPLFLFALLLALSINRFLFEMKVTPFGAWDGWAIWNYHAKFLVSGSQTWRNMFDLGIRYAHPEYPLLTPAAIALGWSFISSTKPILPILLAGFFTYGSVFIVLTMVAKEKGLIHGLVAAAVLAFTPEFFTTGHSQYADTPLGFYFLAGITFLYLSLKFQQSRLLILSGVAVGLAAWTKNEGFLYTFIFIAVLGLDFIYELVKNRKKNFAVLNFLIGLLPVLLIVLIYKYGIAPPDDLTSNRNMAEIVSKISNPQRIQTVLSMYGERLPVFNGGYMLYVFLLSLVLFGWAGFSKQIALPFLILLLALIAYIFIYIFTKQEVVWHITFSLTRLFMQLLPSLVLCCWLTVKGDVFRWGSNANRNRPLPDPE